MSVCLLNVDPASPKFKAGQHLCKEVSEQGVKPARGAARGESVLSSCRWPRQGVSTTKSIGSLY